MTVYVIAEAGVNHNGSLNIAKAMVDEAKYVVQIALNFRHLFRKASF